MRSVQLYIICIWFEGKEMTSPFFIIRNQIGITIIIMLKQEFVLH